MLPFVITCVSLKGTVLSEMSQEEKEKYCMISSVCRNSDKLNSESRIVVDKC